MKLGLAVWNERISPVFDAAQQLLVLEMEEDRVVSRLEQAIGSDEPLSKAGRLAALGIDTLVCGAVSRPVAEAVVAHGIRLIPFVAGGTEEVIAAFIAGALPSPALAMPGCCGRRAGFRGGSGGRRCRRGNGGWRKEGR